MAIEKRKTDGSKIKPDEKYEGKALDWDTELGGPVVEVPEEAQPRNAADADANQSVSTDREDSGSAKGASESDASGEPEKSAELGEPESGSDAPQ